MMATGMGGCHQAENWAAWSKTDRSRKRLMTRNLLCVGAIVVASTIGPQPVQSYPRNPQRPMNAKTCEQALARLHEARLGSPIISAAENREVLRRALEVAERLCGKDKVNDGK